jgi:hypothetical protein
MCTVGKTEKGVNLISCYNLKFQVFTGEIGNKTETGLGQRVVLDLMSGMEGKNHIVFMDNFLFMNCSKN